MRLLFFILIISFYGNSFASSHLMATIFGATSQNFLPNTMDFEDTQANDLLVGGTWSVNQAAGTADLDYTTTVIDGSQSAYFKNGSTGSNGIFSPTFAPQSTLYYRFKFQSDSTVLSAIHGIAFYPEGEAAQGYTYISSGYRVRHGTATALVLSGFTANTTYYVCGKYVVGTGSNGIHRINIGTSATPSENTTGGLTDGTGTTLPINIALKQSNSPSLLIDSFKLSTEAITECAGAGL